MKQSLRKFFGAVSIVFLIGLFVTAAPVRAASTDERIKALAAELNQLKAEQERVKQEQSQINEDALAARSKLPSFRYRPGSGLRIRGADKSWEYRVTGEMSAYLSFFPSIGRSPSDSEDEGPTQGSMFLRHQQWGHYARLLNGLYEFGFNMKFDREGGDRARASSQRMQVRFNTWSPYYPIFQVLHISNRNFSRNTRVSSSSGHVTEREPSYTDFLSTGSSKGLALSWERVPVGPSRVNFWVGYYSGSDQFNARVAEDPNNQKGFGISTSVDPLRKSKNKYLKGLNLRFNYIDLADDSFRGGGNDQMKVTTRTRTNRVTLFIMNTRGRHTYIEPSIDYTVGPFNIAYTWARNAGEQRYTGKSAGSNFSQARITNNIIAGGVFLWSKKKGFLSGSRNGGVRLSYTHNRIYIDAGSGFAAGETDAEFSAMRRWHNIENIILLRWYQQRNLTWAIQYEINTISKMKGGAGSKAEESRRRANILSDGGTYQVISFHTKWIF